MKEGSPRLRPSITCLFFFHTARFELPGIGGLNFVLSHSLGGGGVASLRIDPQVGEG